MNSINYGHNVDFSDLGSASVTVSQLLSLPLGSASPPAQFASLLSANGSSPDSAVKADFRPSYEWINRDFRSQFENELRNFGAGLFDPDDITGVQIRRFTFDELIGMNGPNDIVLMVQVLPVTFRLIIDAAAFA